MIFLRHVVDVGACLAFRQIEKAGKVSRLWHLLLIGRKQD